MKPVTETEHGMKIIFPLNNTQFDSLKEYVKKAAEWTGEEMLCTILYMEN